MCHTNKTLPDNRGMTLLEVMMAVAVFGIILVFVTQMTNTSSRIAADNSAQVRMMELARAEAERIRAEYNSGNFPISEVTNFNYEPSLNTIDMNKRKEGLYLKIIIVEDTDKYDLVTWLPPIN